MHKGKIHLSLRTLSQPLDIESFKLHPLFELLAGITFVGKVGNSLKQAKEVNLVMFHILFSPSVPCVPGLNHTLTHQEYSHDKPKGGSAYSNGS